MMTTNAKCTTSEFLRCDRFSPVGPEELQTNHLDSLLKDTPIVVICKLYYWCFYRPLFPSTHMGQNLLVRNYVVPVVEVVVT